MSYSVNDKNEDISEQGIDRPDRRADGDRRRESRMNYKGGELRDNIPRRMSDFSEIMLDDD